MNDIKNQEVVEWTDNNLLIGSGAYLDDIFQIERCPEILRTTLSGFVSWQKRAEIRVAKILQSPNLTPQFAAALSVMHCEVVMCDGKTQKIIDWIKKSNPNKIADVMGMIVRLDDRKINYAKVGLSPSDVPIVFAAASLILEGKKIQEANLALTGVGKKYCIFDQVGEVMNGKDLSKSLIGDVAEIVTNIVTPIGDYRGSVEYRKAMARLMTKRAFELCLKGVD